MPRGSKKSANQHNTRHENGVVAPGKRIRKHKSNGHLNGSCDGVTQSKTPPSRSSSTSQSAALPDKSTNGHSTALKNGFHASIPAAELRRKMSKEAVEETELPANACIHVNGPTEHSHRKIDVNAAKSSVTHNGSIFHLAYTILRSCPLADTIAILIFLLSLPQTLLTLTNGLFAVLTFMPPAGSFSSFPATLNEVFQGSGGTPSLATIVLTDLIGLVLWLILWAPLQSLALELAQAVVATTLGGGNTSKLGGSDSTLLCMLVVSISHIAHHRWIPNRIFDYEWSTRLSSLPYITGRRPFLGDDIRLARSPAGWLRVLIALHIVIQGLVHVARRWYTKREYSQAKISSKKSDPEAVGGSSLPSGDVPSPEIKFSGSVASPGELTSKSSIPNLKENREKVSSGKKKRKQGSYVRSQQPLWAAFAATKVTILREYEQSYALSEAVGSNATDTKNLGSAPFSNEEGCVWITLVQPTKFCFGASYFSTIPSHKFGNEVSALPVSAEVDRTKPVYVRINGANWTSTQIERLPVNDSANESADMQWSGEVFGLSPASSYVCCFVRSEDDVVIFSTRVSTPSSPIVKKESSISITPPLPSKRPSSPTTPTTTLMNSIAALDSSLDESQLRHKRNKKDSKAALAAIKREIDILNARISKVNCEDKAHQNRRLQWNQHTRQADEATNLISAEIDSLGSVPEDASNQWKEKKTLWDEARERQLSAREDLFRCKEDAHREQSAVEAEASATQQRRERFQHRQAKLNDQRTRLQSATSQGPHGKEESEAEHARTEDLRQTEKKMNEDIANYVRAIEETRYHTSQTMQQVELIESAFRQHQHLSAGQGGRVTPEGDLLSLNPYTPASNISGFRFPAFAPPDHSTPLYGNLPSLRHETRGRSVSLLSGNSVYTDFSDQDPAPPMPSSSRAKDARRGRPPSYSSGSGSGSVSSQRDQVSPFAGVIGQRPTESPLEKRRSPVWNP